MRQLKIAKQITERDFTSLDIYLQEISKLKLLSVEEEANLGRQIKHGDRKALEIMITSNLRFVVSVAKQYQNHGLTLPDLINEGNLGLIKAAERFDESRGFKFISYGVWWVRQSILQAIAENSRIIRIPLNKIGTISKVKSAFTKLEQFYEREPMPEEIAELLKFRTSIVQEALQTPNSLISTDAPLRDGETDDNTLYDVLVNNDASAPDKILMDNSLRIEIERVLKFLNRQQAEILRYYFGLIGDYPLTLDEIGTLMKYTPERVFLLKEKALKKLKNIHMSHLLSSYLS